MNFSAGTVLEQVDLNNMVAALNGDGVYAYPGAASLVVEERSSPAMSVQVDEGRCFIEDVLYSVGSSGHNIGIANSHATLYRKDLITFDPTTGVPIVTKGTDHAGGEPDPIYPPNIPTGDILLAIVNVDPGATAILNSDIDDKRIMVTSSVYDLGPGGAQLDYDGAEVNIGTTAYVWKKEFIIPDDLRAFNMELLLSWSMKGVATGSVYGQIWRNYSAVGAEKSIVGSQYTGVSDIVGGWSAGDRVQLYAKRGTSTDGHAASFKVSGAYIKPW